MMRQLYSYSEKWYNISSAETNRLSGLFLLPNSFNTIILVNLAAASKGPGLFVSAPTDKAKRGCGFYFAQLNRKAQAIQAPEPLEDHGMNVKKTAERMIAALPVVVKKLSQMLSQVFPKESPGGPSLRPASNSILSLLLARLKYPGLSALFPPLAASIVDTSLSGAASSYVQLKLFYLAKGVKVLCV